MTAIIPPEGTQPRLPGAAPRVETAVDELCFLPATELLGLIAARKISSEEVTRGFLERIAAPFAEHTVLRIAQAFEQATEWHQKRPVAL